MHEGLLVAYAGQTGTRAIFARNVTGFFLCLPCMDRQNAAPRDRIESRVPRPVETSDVEPQNWGIHGYVYSVMEEMKALFSLEAANITDPAVPATVTCATPVKKSRDLIRQLPTLARIDIPSRGRENENEGWWTQKQGKHILGLVRVGPLPRLFESARRVRRETRLARMALVALYPPPPVRAQHAHKERGCQSANRAHTPAPTECAHRHRSHALVMKCPSESL